MTILLRPVRPDDYTALALCNRAAMPGVDDTAEGLQDDESHATAFERWVAEVETAVVGSASWFQLPSRFHPQKFWMDGAVYPDYQGRGIGAALFAQVLEALAPKNPISLRTFSREDYAGTRRFLAKHGFVEAKRTWESFLDLTTADFGRYVDRPIRVEAQGIHLRTLLDLQQELDWPERLLGLYNTIQADVPDIDAAAVVAMEQFRKSYLGSGSFLPAGHYIAVDHDRWVGMSTLWSGGKESLLDTGLTGVIPAYRHRGIALALKLRSLAWAREQGVTQIRTTNASSNEGMLAINDRLGFVKRPAWLHLLKQF